MLQPYLYAHHLITGVLLIICVFLSLFLSRKMSISYCNKTEEELCSSSEENINTNCENANFYRASSNIFIMHILVFPIIIFVIVCVIIFIILVLFNIKVLENIEDEFGIIALFVLMIIVIILIRFYYSIKNSCLDDNYICNIKSTYNTDEDGTITKIDTCVPNIGIIKYLKYKSIDNINHFIFNVLILILLIGFYKFDTEYNLLSNIIGSKFSKEINILPYSTIVIILFIVNLIFNRTYLQYVVNSTMIIIFTIFIIFIKNKNSKINTHTKLNKKYRRIH